MRAASFSAWCAMLLGCSHASSPAVSAIPAQGDSGVTAASAVPAPAPAPIAAPPPPTARPEPPRHQAPGLGPEEAREVLFPSRARTHPPGVPASLPPCDEGDDAARITCLVAALYAPDADAAKLATDLYARTGDLLGLLPDETMDGGFRGTLKLVPALPIGRDRKHLEWVSRAMSDFDAFFAKLTQGQKAEPAYVWRGLALRFMRSVDRTTPSAYANDWTIAYNLVGSLNRSADAVRELLFHENFHLNDMHHGDFSVRVLGSIFDAIVARCGTRMACLTPYTPTDMTVRGGTYYAFQPNNGAAVREYAAELALRYYREQRAELGVEGAPKVARAFKCGPLENATAWHLVVEEFFGGIDRTPACP